MLRPYLTQIREILRKVVSQGLAKPAGSKQFSVSGKTGTAQISQGAAGYKSGRVNYLVSFCGYFLGSTQIQLHRFHSEAWVTSQAV